MTYYDEDIIKAKNSYKAGITGNIFDGITLKEEHIEFEQQKIFNEKICVYLPKSFHDMPQNLRELKYPMNARPEIIKTNADGDVNFCFNLLQQEVRQEDLKRFTEQMRKIIKRIQTAAVMYDVFYVNEAGRRGKTLMQTTEQIDGRKNMSIFDYKLPAIDEAIYYYTIFIPINQMLFQATFSCCYKDAENWKTIFELVADQIRINEEI